MQIVQLYDIGGVTMTKKMAIEEMTEEWVMLWYQCLLGNMDYFSYCIAIAERDVKTQEGLEAKFEHIAEIYSDFGDVDIIEDYSSSSMDWCEWFEPRRHLFMADVRQVNTQPQQLGHIVFDVPMTADVERTKARVSMFLDEYYKTNIVVPAQEPKYKLHLKPDGRVGCGLQSVRNACLLQRGCYKYPLDPNDDRYDLPFIEALKAFLKKELDNLNWQFDSMAKENARLKADFLEKGKLTENCFEKFKVQVNRSRKDFKQLASNVLRKRFPDLSPFESSVVDQFDSHRFDSH